MWKEAYKGDMITYQSNSTHHSRKLSTRIDAGVTTSNPTILIKITMWGVLGTQTRCWPYPCHEALEKGWLSLNPLCSLPNGGACRPHLNAAAHPSYLRRLPPPTPSCINCAVMGLEGAWQA